MGLYVNGAYRDDSDLGKLMHDFFCWNPDEMHFEMLKDVTRYYKEDPYSVDNGSYVKTRAAVVAALKKFGSEVIYD